MSSMVPYGPLWSRMVPYGQYGSGVVTCRSRVSKVVFEATVNGKPITGFHIGEFETINMALIWCKTVEFQVKMAAMADLFYFNLQLIRN